MVWSVLSLAVASLGLAWSAGGRSAQFAARADVVEVYVTVTGHDETPVADLTRDDFLVYEEGRPQPITVFASGPLPLRIAIVIDRSWSMAGRPLELARAGARVLLEELGPADQSLLIAIGSEVEVLAPLSAERGAARSALAALDLWGSTSLHDGLLAALEWIGPVGGRRALLVLSDGDDRSSRATAAEVLDAVRRTDVLVYPVACGRRLPPLFVELAVASGGRSFHVSDLRQVAAAMRAVVRELRAQYLLGYPVPPGGPGDGARWRTLRVEVRRPGVRVRARDGYWYLP